MSGLPSSEVRIAHLRWMILARSIDDRMAKLKSQGEVPGNVFLARGQEAYSAAAGMFLKPGDIAAPLIRDTAMRLSFGEPLIDALRSYLGRKTGPMKGRDGNIHRGKVELGQLPMISHLGAMVSAVAGGLMAKRILGTLGDSVGVASIGDGGMATGALHEGLNVAAVEKLPLVLLVANNQVSYSTFNDRSFACADLVDRAKGYGVAGWSCDGTDADQCIATVSDAITAARSGGGVQLVVATLLRLAGHGTHDDATYVTPEMKSRWGDCLQLAERTLIKSGVIDEAGVRQLWDEARSEINLVVQQAMSEPTPDPATEDWYALSTRDLAKARP